MKRNLRSVGFGIVTCCILALPGNGFSQDLTAATKLTESEQFEAAAAKYRELIRKTPANGDVYFYFGDNYLRSYLVDSANVTLSEIEDSARAVFKKGTELDPSNSLNYVGLGKLSLLNSDLKTAQSYFDKAQSTFPVKITKNSPISPERMALVLLKIAQSYVQSPVRDTSVSLPILRRAAKLDPKNPEIFIVTGNDFLEANDGSKAILNYNKAQELDPKSPKAKMKIGQLWVRARNYNDALGFYKDAIKIDSTYAPTYRELGDLYALARQYDNAIINYQKFLDLSSNNISAKISYARALINAKYYKDAIGVLNDIIKEDTSRNDLNRALAYSYYETSQYDKGLVYSQKFFKRAKPEKIMPSDYVYYGRLLAKNKMDSLAIVNLTKAYQLDTANADLLSEIAISYNKVKKYDMAAISYETKIAVKRAIPNDYYNLGKVYYNLQQWGKADTALSTFLLYQPDHIQGILWKARVYVNMDPDTKEGKAKPVFETMIEKAKVDSVKFTKELIEAYSYLAFYYLINKEFATSKQYWEKVLALDPKNEKANKAMENPYLKGK